MTCPFGSTQLASAGFDDIFIYKQTPTGGDVRAVRAGWPWSGSNLRTGNGFTQQHLRDRFFSFTADFGAYCLSTSGSPLDIDPFIAKYDPSGTCLWATSFSGADAATGYGIDVDKNGDVIVTGQFKDSITIGSFVFVSDTDTVVGQPSHDVFIAKLDSSGNVLWAKQGKAPYNDRGLDVAVDGDNSIYVVGEFSDTIINTTTANSGYYILKAEMAGCSAGPDSVYVMVNNCSSMTQPPPADHYNVAFFPNIFSPNGDGNNDTWRVYGANVTGGEIHIFDRLGEEVFSAAGPPDKVAWDGQFQAQPMNSGVFVYRCHVSFADGTNEDYTGNFTIVY